jgi:hypothetical protein
VARKGDPSAFYTLVAPHARATYQALRNSGKNHKETMLVLVPFLKSLYRGFFRKPDDENFDSWYLSKQKKHLGNEYEALIQNPAEEIFLEGVSAADYSHLDSQMKLLFMRNYNKVKARKKSLATSWSESALLRWTVSLFLLVAFCAACYLYLAIAHVLVTVSIASKSFHHSLQLPFSAPPQPTIFENSASSKQTHLEVITSDSLRPAMMATKNPRDTMHKTIAQRKPFKMSKDSIVSPLSTMDNSQENAIHHCQTHPRFCDNQRQPAVTVKTISIL